MSLRTKRQLSSCLAQPQLFIHIPIINEEILSEVLDLLPEGRGFERIKHWIDGDVYPNMFFIKIPVEKEEVLGFPADHRLGYSNHTTEELFSNRSSFCALCSLPLSDEYTFTWQDVNLGCNYDVHKHCAEDRELTARFNNAVASYMYGGGESDSYPIEDGIYEEDFGDKLLHQTNYPDLKKFVATGTNDKSQ